MFLYLSVAVLSTFLKIGVISASFKSSGNTLCSMQSLNISCIGWQHMSQLSFRTLVVIPLRVLAFLGLRWLISYSITSVSIFENANVSEISTFSFIIKILGWISNFFIAASTGSYYTHITHGHTRTHILLTPSPLWEPHTSTGLVKCLGHFLEIYYWNCSKGLQF